MLFTDTDIICRRMNECGAEGRPFLFVVDYEMAEGYFVEYPMEQAELLFKLNGVGNKPNTSRQSVPGTLKVSPIPPEEYKKMFDVVSEGLERGETVLTNLTVRTPIETDLSLEDIFSLAGTKYQLLVPGRFVCFSPECFVRISDGRIATFPMKGTVDASIPNAEAVITDWRALFTDLVVKYNQGFIYAGGGIPHKAGYPKEWLDMSGYAEGPIDYARRRQADGYDLDQRDP